MANTAIIDRTDNELIDSVKELINLLIRDHRDPASSQG